MLDAVEVHSGPIHVEYVLTPDDVVRGVQLQNRAMLWSRRTLRTVTVMLAPLVALVAFTINGDWVALGVIVGGGVVGAIAVPTFMIRFVVPRRARRLHARSDVLRAPLVIQADRDFLRIRSSDGDTRFPWPEVVGWREDDAVVLLCHSSVLFHIVPKRVLPRDRIDGLRALYEAGRRGHARPADETAVVRDATTLGGPWVSPVLATSATWTVTRRDLVAAQRLYLRWRWTRPRALASPALLAACGGVFAASTPGLDRLQIAGLVLTAPAVALVFRAAIYAMLPFTVGNFVRRQPSLGHVWRVAIDERGCRSLTQHQDLYTPWSRYVAWAQDGNVILLYRSDMLYQFVPLRAVDAHLLSTLHEVVAGLPRR